jgi:hypothetical protein
VTQHMSTKRAVFLASLAESEPAKRKARAHAAVCASCAKLLQESEQLLALIDHSAQPMLAVDTQLAERVRHAVFGAAPAPRRRWPWLAWLSGGALSALMIWLDVRPNAALGPGTGLDCMLWENGFALATCVAGAIWARTRERAIDPWTGSVVGMSGALLGQLFLRTHCEAAHAGLHLLTFHLLGVLIGTSLGALVAPALTRAR